MHVGVRCPKRARGNEESLNNGGKGSRPNLEKKQTQIGTAMKPKAHIECARMYAVHPVKHELLQRK